MLLKIPRKQESNSQAISNISVFKLQFLSLEVMFRMLKRPNKATLNNALQKDEKRTASLT